jgi:myo-inositol-1(or 4)-monophosphatase
VSERDLVARIQLIWVLQAGIVIAQEAGGVVTGSHAVLNTTSADVDLFKVTPEILSGRKYLVIRGIPDLPNETGRQAQLRIAKEFYDTVKDTEPN